VGIPAGELTRWVFRLLSSLLGPRGGAVRIETLHDGDDRAVRVEVPGRALAPARATLEPLALEIESAGGRMAVSGDDRSVRVRVDLPAACGEAPRPTDLGASPDPNPSPIPFPTSHVERHP
jgi:hypothetical protein